MSSTAVLGLLQNRLFLYVDASLRAASTTVISPPSSLLLLPQAVSEVARRVDMIAKYNLFMVDFI